MRQTIPWQDSASPHAVRELAIDPRRTALVVVDMQRYGETPRPVLATNLQLRDFFRANDLPVIFLRVGSFLPDARDQHAKRRLSWLRRPGDAEPYRCPRGSVPFELCEELAPLPTELVLDKTSSGAFNSSPLDLYLRNLGVQNLVITGVSTNHCVDSTARDAADRGYNVMLVEDACNDNDPVAHRATLAAFARHFGPVRRTEEVVALLGEALAREPVAAR
jgi:nicotinamidase-related amidase